MAVIPAEAVPLMRAALVALCEDAGSFSDSKPPQPLAGSLAAAEWLHPDLKAYLLAAHSEATLLLETCMDYAFALTRLLVGPIPTVAPWTCVRGGLEAAALSCWLLSDSIDARERASRSFAYRYAGLVQQKALATAIDDQALIVKTLSRMDELEEQARTIGYPCVQNRKGKRDGVGQRMPKITRVVADNLDEEEFYRVLSSMAHGHSWVVMQLGFRAPDPAIPILLRKHIDPASAATLIVKAANCVAKPLWAKARLFGHDLDALADILDRRYTDLCANESQRFWTDGGSS